MMIQTRQTRHNRTFSTRFLLAPAVLVSGFLGAALTPQAHAHDLWIMPDKAAATSGQDIAVRAVLGHNYPAGSFQPKSHLKMSVTLPDGKEMPLATTNAGISQVAHFKPPTTGQYVFSANYTAYLSHTAQGTVYLPRDQLGNTPATTSRYVSQCSKAIVGVGKTAMKPIGLPIELVPSVDPTIVKVGGLLPVQVLWKGKPLGASEGSEVEVKAVYAGFQADADTFAFLGRADKEGRSRVKITAPGWWMVMVEHRAPSADKSKADEEIYIGTLVFYVAPSIRPASAKAVARNFKANATALAVTSPK